MDTIFTAKGWKINTLIQAAEEISM